MIVLQSYISKTGSYSRRQAEELIRAGRVRLNGELAELGMRASENDIVEIDGEQIGLIRDANYVMFNKPIGYTCTKRNFQNEKNIFSLLPKEYEGLHVVGRLDKDSHGLIILTNDGQLTQRLTHPSFEHEKEYRVSIFNFQFEIFKDRVYELVHNFLKGIDIGDGDGIVKARVCEYLGENRFRIVLTEGKKRQIRRMFRVCGFQVEDLLRVRIGRLVLGDLKEGEFRSISKDQC
jgi:pseudouridine synthase